MPTLTNCQLCSNVYSKHQSYDGDDVNGNLHLADDKKMLMKNMANGDHGVEEDVDENHGQW